VLGFHKGRGIDIQMVYIHSIRVSVLLSIRQKCQCFYGLDVSSICNNKFAPISPSQLLMIWQLQRGRHGKGINLESASVEEIRFQADLVGKEIDEALERTR
jgi:hypothetical protein